MKTFLEWLAWRAVVLQCHVQRILIELNLSLIERVLGDTEYVRNERWKIRLHFAKLPQHIRDELGLK